MKINENMKVSLVVFLFFTVICLISFLITEPEKPKEPTTEELYQLSKDSLSDERIKKELDSNYIFEHSKIPNNGSN